ncbi:nucleotide sugar dehydrogenase [Halobacillus halophilus]|uniref:nucleotide sugar dehydrogenase n=1 Tax=Halobacillus halophilus TaxID=1570 RepID=UPI001CD6EB9B|nr:nucleotide sugar dehydrogenase [Halobacillus halophilus]MCA1012700.1 nucleotide sugar dehydrogenase [Halobacillus halophilus]
MRRFEKEESFLKLEKGNRPVVCVQGLGFVGAAMAVAVSNAKDTEGNRLYDVIGVDLPTEEGKRRADAITQGLLPFENSDIQLKEALASAHRAGNLIAVTNSSVYTMADVIIVDVNLDISYEGGKADVPLSGFRKAIQTIGESVQPDTLIIVETTVPPGTCENVVVPELNQALVKRGLPKHQVHVSHSYERVMPGKDYLDSIINYWRVYAGVTEEAGDRCETFLSSIINTKDYPMTRLHSTTASETAKVLENSYRAMTIAFMEEWGRFAESVDIDMFQIIEAIRMRPTHSNMRQPGFGVGGYCLTKDPLFAQIAAEKYYQLSHIDFEFCKRAVEVNRKMPMVSFNKLYNHFKQDLKGKKVALFGVSYRQDVGDTRYSPSEPFVKKLTESEAIVDCYDPLVPRWEEMKMDVQQQLPSAPYDAMVFAVGHQEYRQIDFRQWLNGRTPLVLDANNVLSDEQRLQLRTIGCDVISIGRGDNL